MLISKNLVTRIIVAAIAIPAILWISDQGGFWLFGLVTVLSVLAMTEILSGEGYGFDHPLFWLAQVCLLAALVSSARSLFWTTEAGDILQSMSLFLFTLPIITIFFLLSGLYFSLGTQPPEELFRRHSRLVWGIGYILMLYPYVFALGDFSRMFAIDGFTGGDCLLLLFGILWLGDTAAMWVGSTFGRHKLAPGVSPNKTIEGFLGGLAAAVVVGIVIGLWKFQSLSLIHLIFIALGCSIFGQLGDLVESMWKRSLGKKDSSGLIPGHGGVLDRFDSLLFAAPFMYGYLILLVT
ncbi:MAG: phosphatidate cytidylyltransferase [candidate division Zixibacteria bacterium]|nr:phosphatidate cytidylyltransferase [candidate division Zixibacteria bacterium]